MTWQSSRGWGPRWEWEQKSNLWGFLQILKLIWIFWNFTRKNSKNEPDFFNSENLSDLKSRSLNRTWQIFIPAGAGLDLGWSPAHCNLHWGPKFYSVHSIEIVVFTQREHAPCRHAIMTWHGLLHKGFHINWLCWLQYTKTLTLKCRYHLT